ncbi:YceI family protein [Intrasporangium sp.]|uniref:YceI family protein n=1 Tax=Intrasporangium sp. TaxID=1925024 RepID=UPI0032218356
MTSTIAGYRAGVWRLDPAHSEIGFVARHMMVSKVRGRFTGYTATITTAENLTDSHVEVQVDLSSITTGIEARDNHLRSSDFFNVATSPTMTFRSTAIRPDGDDWAMDGELSIRGVTRPVTLAVEIGGFTPDPAGGTRAGFSAAGQINRHDFGVNWNAALEGGGVVVGDKVAIAIEAEAILDE